MKTLFTVGFIALAVLGCRGSEGPAGSTGPQGAAGQVGAAGAVGPTGPMGDWGMIPHPHFDQDLTGFTLANGSGSAAVSASPLGGGKAFANAVNESPWVSSDARIPVNRHWTYEVRGSFRRQTLTGSAGGVYLAVRMFDDTGTDITGDGSWWFYPVSNVALTDTNWHTYSAKFGSSTPRSLPAGARTMSVGAILNYDGAVAGNRAYEVTGLEIAPTGRPPIYVGDTRAVCGTGGSTAGVTVLVSSGAFVLDRPAYVHVQTNMASNANGRRDVELRVDGTAVFFDLARTEVKEWATHQAQWTGQLSAGSHTVELRANTTLGASDGYGCGVNWGNLTVLFLD